MNHVRGGLAVGNKDNYIKLRAIPRIGILVNQLRYSLKFLRKWCVILTKIRRLLDAQLQKCFEDGRMLPDPLNNPILHAIMALLTHDGMSE